jgi:hypothetical protein
MGYVSVPRRGAALYGLGDAYSNFPSDTPSAAPSPSSLAAQAQAFGDQSKAQAIAYANAQLDSYPTAATVAETYSEYAGYLTSIPGFKPSDMTDPAKATALVEQALINYAVAQGYPVTTAALKQQLINYAASVASSELGVDIPTNWPSNIKDLKSVAVDVAVTAVVMYTGVDPRILTVTYDALKDGKLTQDECEAIGTTAGAIAGAVIAQACGIPAPIGAIIGGEVGFDVGGTFAEIFSIHPPDTRLADMYQEEKTILAQGQTLCDTARSLYWSTFDKLIMATELQWRAAELKIGWKFGLRWYGQEPGARQPFSHAYNPASGYFDGPLTTANRASQFGGGTDSTYCSSSGDESCVTVTEYVYGCAFDYGCPYPVITSISLPTGFERDVQAFFARGALWIPPGSRSMTCSLPPPPVATNAGDVLYNWIDSINQLITNEQAALDALNTISVVVVGDLVRTVAANTAEQRINAMLRAPVDALNAAAIARGEALAEAKIVGKNLSNFLNYGGFVLGAGLLLAALYKRNQ